MTQPGTAEILKAIADLRTEVKDDIRDSTLGLTNQLADVAGVAREALNTSREAMQKADRALRRIDGSLPPSATPPDGTEAAPKDPNASKPVTIRMSETEGGLTDVIGQIANLKADVAEVKSSVDTVVKLNERQNKTMGLADEAASLGRKAYTFIMSREGATFAVRLAGLAAVVYYVFTTQLAARQPPQLPPAQTTSSLAPPGSPP